MVASVALAISGLSQPVAGQEAPHPRAALLQCLMTAAEPGERVDRICADLAVDVCGVARGALAADECRAELACRFAEEGEVLLGRSGDGEGAADAARSEWAATVAACDTMGEARGGCLRDGARAFWIAARADARAAEEDLDVSDDEVARCFLD